MENSTQEMILVGYHHFTSKDKKQIYFVVQCLYNEEDRTRGNLKGTMINIFVEEETYKKIIQDELQIGSVLKVEVRPNLSTGKIYYRVVI